MCDGIQFGFGVWACLFTWNTIILVVATATHTFDNYPPIFLAAYCCIPVTTFCELYFLMNQYRKPEPDRMSRFDMLLIQAVMTLPFCLACVSYVISMNFKLVHIDSTRPLNMHLVEWSFALCVYAVTLEVAAYGLCIVLLTLVVIVSFVGYMCSWARTVCQTSYTLLVNGDEQLLP